MLREDNYGMRISAWMMAAALLVPGPGGTCAGRRDPTYKVDFTIRDTGDAGGKTGRKYSLLVNRNAEDHVQGGQPGTGGHRRRQRGTLVNTQFTYIDVGMNIECVVAEAGSQIRDPRGPGYQHGRHAG